MKKVDTEQAIANVARRAYADFKAGVVITYDDLLNTIDEYLDQEGLTAFEYGDDAVDAVRDTYHISVCDMCGELMPERAECIVGGLLMAGLAEMAQAGETDYLRDDLREATLICKKCAERVANYHAPFEWQGRAYGTQAELDADKLRSEKFRAEGASLDELPKWAKFELKQKLLDQQNAEKGEGTSIEELFCADYLISDGELEREFGGVSFFIDDFTSAE